MVLSGNLEEAELLKKENKLIEKEEIDLQYQAMTDSFEIAKAKLLLDHQEEISKQKIDHDFRKKSLIQEINTSIEIAEKRIQTTQLALDEGSNMEKFLAKKFKKSSDNILPLSVMTGQDDLPPLQRTKGIGSHSFNLKENSFSPLTLPPLKPKNRKNIK